MGHLGEAADTSECAYETTAETGRAALTEDVDDGGVCDAVERRVFG